ncbi:9250_t:CDS:1, partial [Funneliformis geosporum]
DKVKKILILFPITSNRHDYRDYTGRYKILYRCPYLEDEKYPESFVNADILIIVPFEAILYLDFCSECSSFCLKEDFEEITQLHSVLPNYKIEIDKVDITIEYFKTSKEK